MKALAIVGSPNPRGSTSFLVEKIIQGLESNQIECKTYCLGEQHINFCTGCKQCYKEGVCPVHDDMDKIISDYKDADIVIIGSPDYWGDVSGQLKVFIDRNTPYANTNEHRIHFEKKRFGISVSVREGTTDRENIVIVNTIEHFFSHMEIQPIASLTVTQVSRINDLLDAKADKIDEAFMLGKNVHALINA